MSGGLFRWGIFRVALDTGRLVGGGWARRGISLSAKLLSFPLVTAPLNDELPIGPPSKDHPDGGARKPEHDQHAGDVPPPQL
jgi:hypothetical protein